MVYEIYQVSNRRSGAVVYIGQTTRLEQRKRQHYAGLFPKNNYSVDVVARAETPADADRLELELIASFSAMGAKLKNKRGVVGDSGKFTSGRVMLWPEKAILKLVKGTFSEISSVLKDDEPRTSFIREAVKRELSRRSRKTAKKETGDNGNI